MSQGTDTARGELMERFGYSGEAAMCPMVIQGADKLKIHVYVTNGNSVRAIAGCSSLPWKLLSTGEIKKPMR